MSRVGKCYDKAVVESFFSTLKREVGVPRWTSRAAAYADVAHDIDDFYNTRRLHSTLAYLTPIAYEAAGGR